ncbi:toxin-antitoxin system, toxin component, HicA family protein [Candidatus Roizmanbacteria bacterium CG_4_10_14_0_2_um_filter_39_13]|uniref:Toxin-antitoxin system, toxin component, HicA family protein n=1 Tax=Candidatus Roizmanbacteria bacterium CG_4_10_14_0_2_um_filter_39_13 TaxID=1974825 RepID=A0A2M7TX91_9BACT|nr:MAG: toxin-antitoxin system, toxin component, HicA family protein [Candidatus Roizmanbacteria bacterium CG_4_10_14_0_2_um_filter_39_13]
MTTTPAWRQKKLLKYLLKQGFYIHHQKGSHIVLKHKTNTVLRVTLPMHNKELKKKTLKSILRQSEIDIHSLSIK